MSRFHTSIPVDVEAVKKLLPQRGVHVHGVVINSDDPKQLEVVVDWECDNLRTPYSFPVEFPIQELKEHKLPKGVTFVDAKAPAKTAEVPAPKTAEPKTKTETKVKTPKVKGQQPAK
jgi:hypothetical protein